MVHGEIIWQDRFFFLRSRIPELVVGGLEGGGGGDVEDGGEEEVEQPSCDHH